MPLDFSSPLQAYKWLNCLEPHTQFGCLIKPNLHLRKQHLGFSFSSNEAGLRGPLSDCPETLIIGTSFAMGFSVDIGKNWYDLIDFNVPTTNIGLPVGFQEWNQLYEHYKYKSASKALVIYHCNFYSHEEKFASWRESNIAVNDFFRWKTSFYDALKLHLNSRFRSQRKERRKVINWKKKSLTVDTKYALPNKTFQEAWIIELKKFFSNFNEINLVRVLCKEEVLGREGLSKELFELSQLHERNWLQTIKSLSDFNLNIFEIEPNEPDYFLTDDSHLTESGNLFLANHIKSIL